MKNEKILIECTTCGHKGYSENFKLPRPMEKFFYCGKCGNNMTDIINKILDKETLKKSPN